MRILLAEDDTALAGFVRKGLEAESYAVDVSADGEQARALANHNHSDLLFHRPPQSQPGVLHCGTADSEREDFQTSAAVQCTVLSTIFPPHQPFAILSSAPQ
jgi:CheY-like chemotaxis protein